MQVLPSDKVDAESVPKQVATLRERTARLEDKLTAADRAMSMGRLDEAEAALKAALDIEPQNPRASDGLVTVARMRKHLQLNAAAKEAWARGDFAAVERAIREVLVENPKDPQALAMFENLNKSRDDFKRNKPQLNWSGAPISFEFRDAPIKIVFQALTAATGINFILDKDIPTGQVVTMFIKSSPAPDVLESLLAANQLQKKVINQNTVQIYPNSPSKIKEYQDMEMRYFYLANADAGQVANSIKAMLEVKDIQVDPRSNLLILRDVSETIKLAERIVYAMDIADPEVILDVQVLEIQSNKLSELGITWPTQLSVVNGASSMSLAQFLGGAGSKVSALRSDNYQVSPLPKATFSASDADFNILANPSIRVKNRERARIHVGDRIPLITNTTTTTSASITSASIQYIDVGLRLEVAPLVNIDNEVTMAVNLEVSSLGEKTTTATAEAYRVGTRNANTTLKLKDGETQVLAGLINDSESTGTVKVPGLGEIPVLGRLFSNKKNERRKTEVLLAITPHVVRNMPTPSVTEANMMFGTEADRGRATAPDGKVGAAVAGPPPLPPQLAPFAMPGGVAPRAAAPVVQPAPVAAPAPATPAPAAPVSAAPQPAIQGLPSNNW